MAATELSKAMQRYGSSDHVEIHAKLTPREWDLVRRICAELIAVAHVPEEFRADVSALSAKLFGTGGH